MVADDVVDISDALNLDKPDIGTLDDAFFAEVRKLPERNLAVALLERLLEGDIKSRIAGNLVQARKFSDTLADVVQRHQNRFMAAAQVVQALVQMARTFREVAGLGEPLGPSEDGLRFSDALANHASAVRGMSGLSGLSGLGDETLKKIAHQLTENLRANRSVDWSARERVLAKLCLMVERILRKHKYPPDRQDAELGLALQQAKALAEAWA